MQSKLFYLSFLLFGLISCGGEEQKSVAGKKDSADCEKPAITDSELTLLMRDMETQMKVARQCIIDNQPLPDSISLNFVNIHSAIPTDPADHNEQFESFASAFLANTNRIKSAEDSSRVQVFNASVQSCIDCHHSFCPGPIERIGKLRIK